MTTYPLPVAPFLRPRRRLVAILSLLFLLAGLGYLGWHFLQTEQPNSPPTAALQANLRGVGHIEQFHYEAAARDFETAVQLAPDWMPAKVNLGIALLNTVKRDHLARAYRLFQEVLRKEPDNPHAHYCLGILAMHEGRLEDAYPHFEAVARIDPNDALTWLQRGLTHPQGRDSPEAKECFARALKLNPYLNAARYLLAQHPAGDDPRRSKQLLQEHRALSEANWETESRLRYSEMGRYAEVIGHTPDRNPPRVGPLPMFEKWDRFRVKLAEGTSWARPADFGEGVMGDLHRLVRHRFGAVLVFLDFNKDGRLDLFLPAAVVRNKQLGDLLLRNDGDGVFSDVTVEAGLAGPQGRTELIPFHSFGCSVADYDNDGFPDLLLAGAPPRLHRNLGNGKFEDVSAAAGLTALPGVFLSASWIDLDQDGDLDLLLSRFAETPAAARAHLQGKGQAQGELVVLLNTGEAPPAPAGARQPGLTTRFQPLPLPQSLQVRGPVAGTAAGDFDGDRDIDLLLLVDGQPARGVWNDRLLRFHAAGPLGAAGTWNGALVLDVNHDRRSDLLLLRADQPPVLWLSNNKDNPEQLAEAFTAGTVHSPVLRQAQAVDLDLDSWTDVVGLSAEGRAGRVNAPVLLQNDGTGKLVLRPDAFGPIEDALGIGVADLDGDGLPDLVLLTAAGLEVRRNLGNGNHALRLELSGRRDKGSNLRTNADAVGAWVVAQTGALWSGCERTALQAGLGQSSLPVVLGIGKATQAEVVRILWPDGVPQAERNVPTGRVVRIDELNRKGTCCPVLFVWDGQRYRFQTDFLGAGALGEASADGSVRPPRPEESLAIEPGLLAPTEGWYQVKIAEPMDEVLYLDRLQLLVVDHPAGEVVLPDERFVVAGPAPTQELLKLDNIRFVRRATDHRGNDVTARLRERDRRFVDAFHLRSWLGYAEEHWVELDFGPLAPALAQGERWILCLAGWTDYPYPESIYAAEQAGVPLLAPQLEYQSAEGGWKTWGELGFPAGLPRTMTRDVTGLMELSKGRFRIRTNMQVYWDQVFLGRRRQEKEIGNRARVIPLEVGRATLRTRGFAQEVLPGGSPPIAYDDERTESVAVTRWKGRLTRLGDVTELLLRQDDRFVLCGPGDEIEAGFDGRALPPLPEDWVRSFALRTWGYCKDTSPFTLTPGAVAPLPYRSMRNYPPAGLPSTSAEYDRRWNTRPAGK